MAKEPQKTTAKHGPGKTFNTCANSPGEHPDPGHGHQTAADTRSHLRQGLRHEFQFEADEPEPVRHEEVAM